MAYRVTYPLITTDGNGHRDFETREEAEAFAREIHFYLPFHAKLYAVPVSIISSYQLVKVEEVGA